MSYVYVLYNYGEQGAEDVMATLDRRDLPGMLERHQKKREQLPEEEQYGIGCVEADDLKALTALLRRPEAELAEGWMEHRFPNEPLERVHADGRHNLGEGWGGWVLQVTKLYQPKTVKFTS